MREILLTQGKVTFVDDKNYEELSKYKWHAHKARTGGFYALRSFRENGKQYIISMARQILGLERGDKRETDHKNHNTLDNRQDNLRICTCRENLRNRKADSNTSSKFKGVSWDKENKKWRADISTNGKKKNLGRFLLEELAALRYDMVAIREHGEFACLNF